MNINQILNRLSSDTLLFLKADGQRNMDCKWNSSYDWRTHAFVHGASNPTRAILDELFANGMVYQATSSTGYTEKGIRAFSYLLG